MVLEQEVLLTLACSWICYLRYFNKLVHADSRSGGCRCRCLRSVFWRDDDNWLLGAFAKDADLHRDALGHVWNCFCRRSYFRGGTDR